MILPSEFFTGILPKSSPSFIDASLTAIVSSPESDSPIKVSEYAFLNASAMSDGLTPAEAVLAASKVITQ